MNDVTTWYNFGDGFEFYLVPMGATVELRFRQVDEVRGDADGLVKRTYEVRIVLTADQFRAMVLGINRPFARPRHQVDE